MADEEILEGQGQLADDQEGAGDQGSRLSDKSESSPQLTEEEARQRVEAFRESVRKEHEDELRAAGLLVEPKKSGSSTGEEDPWVSDYEQFMDTITGKAKAKFPLDVPGLSATEVQRRAEKQQAYIRREYTRGTMKATVDHALLMAEKKLGKRIDDLAANFTELTASTYFGSRPELAEVSADIRDVIEQRKPVTLEFVQKLLAVGQKQGKAASEPKEQPLLSLVRSKRTGKQMELPSDIAEVVTQDEKNLQKSIDAMWDELIPGQKAAK